MLITVSAAACQTRSQPPDAQSGPGVLTVAPNAIGVIVSDPPGITCGQCALLPPSACADLTVFRQCAAEYPTGTTVTLSITERQDYPDVACVSDQSPAVTACTFVVPYPITVEILSLTL